MKMKITESVMLTIDVEKNGEVAVVHCSGRLVRGIEVSSLRTAVVSQESTRVVILDLSQVEFMDAGGLNALVSLYHWTRDHGVQFKLANPSGLVREMLIRTRLNRVFDMSSLHDVMAILSGVDCRHAKYGAGYLSPLQALAAK
jgi:anti-anti-sigma factor